MHIFIAWSFLSPIIVVVCGQQVYDLYYGARVDIRIGSPIQELVACPSLTTDIIFMISANCGEVDSRRCPRYCYDPLFSEMYCTAECRGMDEIEWCKKPIYRYYKHYDSKNSSTSRRTEDVWNGVLNGHVAQVGQWTRETISFNPAPYNNTRILKMEDWLFVNGMIVNVE
ncbi:hypothetical protein M3Y95_01032200 [Aphelenchoides besseyi]|nr:hypothetical protein M3Y95_01032200 [Aphelenchoides besseyi]